ncbi:MAG: 30S ribosomal protein S4 [Nanoarchaeota archaeon]
MGDPKKLKKKYFTPMHPWSRSAIENERVIMKEYGLKNKKEILIASSFLKKYKNIAKKLIATKTKQADVEKKQVLAALESLGLLLPNSELDNILSLELKDIIERRLQSIVFRKGFARSIKQARQFIIHRHIMLGDKEIPTPSYLVSLKEEGSVAFKNKSSLASEEHPERVTPQKSVQEEAEAIREYQKKSKAGRVKGKGKQSGQVEEVPLAEEAAAGLTEGIENINEAEQ